jgi:hypothetical protein
VRYRCVRAWASSVAFLAERPYEHSHTISITFLTGDITSRSHIGFYCRNPVTGPLGTLPAFLPPMTKSWCGRQGTCKPASEPGAHWCSWHEIRYLIDRLSTCHALGGIHGTNAPGVSWRTEYMQRATWPTLVWTCRGSRRLVERPTASSALQGEQRWHRQR